jgi:hypothetical protein
MRRGEQHAVRAWLEKAASGFAGVGRDACRVARVQVEHLHLVKRIALLALALKNQFAAIRRKITFPAASPLEDELPLIRDRFARNFGRCSNGMASIMTSGCSIDSFVHAGTRPRTIPATQR